MKFCQVTPDACVTNRFLTIWISVALIGRRCNFKACDKLEPNILIRNWINSCFGNFLTKSSAKVTILCKTQFFEETKFPWEKGFREKSWNLHFNVSNFCLKVCDVSGIKQMHKGVDFVHWVGVLNVACTWVRENRDPSWTGQTIQSSR